jgi:hypothetical protein
MYPLTSASSPLTKLSLPPSEVKTLPPIYIHFFILIFMFFTPFSTNPFPYLHETYNNLNRLTNPAQFASTQTPAPILDPLPFLPIKPGDASLP